MLIEHNFRRPQVDPSAWVAPNAVLCGDVKVGSGARILYGAQVIAESGSIAVGRNTIVMENAVLRASDAHPLTLGAACLVGPGAHVVGATVEDEVFIATGAAVFHGARLGRGTEVRIHGVVHLRTRLPEGSTVPIGWVAVGDPARILPPQEHDAIWAVQKELNFPLTVYGIERGADLMTRITERLSAALGSHGLDQPVG
jgi:carbonic anhydrase/acetyltransferase-like protein (isoleucine patch superfamily)